MLDHRFTLLLTLAAAFAAACGMTGVLRSYALRRGIIDLPNARSSHAVPTPRGGGVAFVLVFLGALALMLAVPRSNPGVGNSILWALLVGGGIAALIGFIDDHGHIPARWRFLTHVAAAALALYLLNLPWHWFWLVFATVGLVWLLNLFNFMDGIDAIAASEAISALLAATVIAAPNASVTPVMQLWLLLAAGVGGFLAWNWPPAHIFMGDAASGFLGLTLGLLAITAMQDELLPLASWLVLFGCFIVDATYTLLRRIAGGERWYEAHRSHAYQKIAARWQSQRLNQGFTPEQSRAWAHRNTTLALLAINAGWLFPLAWSAAARPQWAVFCTLLAWAPLVVVAVKARAGVTE